MLNAVLQRDCSRLAAVLAALALSVCAGAVQPAPLDWIVAVVNKEPVLHSTLQKEIDRMSAQILDSGQSLPTAVSLYDRMLSRLVNRKLQLQRARQLGMGVTDAQIATAVEDLMQNRKFATVDDLLRYERVSLEELRTEVREEIMINRALSFDMSAELRVPDEDVDLLLRTGLATQLEPELLLRQIQLPHGEEKLAAKVRRRAAAGEDFAQLADEFSVAPNAGKGGALGWLRARELPAELIAAVRALAPGAVSAVVDLDNGLHIVKVEAIRPIAPGEQRIAEVLMHTVTRDQREEIVELGQRLLSGEASFGEVADAAGSVPEWIALYDLPGELGMGESPRIGEVAGPVEVDGKWMIARVVNLKYKETVDYRLRREAEALALADRFERARRDWIAQLKSVGHVRILRTGG